MKTLNAMPVVLILLAVCVGECVAQSTSSASQTITFGVHRTVVPSLAANFSRVSSVDESPALNPTPLKVTVGSDARSEEFAISERLSAVKKTRRQQSINLGDFAEASESPYPPYSAPPKSVVTVTD